MTKITARQRLLLIIVGIVTLCCLAFLAFAFVRAGIASLAGWTPTPTRTATITRPPTFTKTPRPTKTPTFTKTTRPTRTPTFTKTPWPTKTSTFTPTATATSGPPTDTPTPQPPTDTFTPAPAKIVIAAVNKVQEYVDIRNIGDFAQALSGWVLLSEKGEQRCSLGGILGPGQTLRIWAMKKDADKGGYNCGFGNNIWNNDDPDPAVLYDAQGIEIDRK